MICHFHLQFKELKMEYGFSTIGVHEIFPNSVSALYNNNIIAQLLYPE